MNNTRRTPDRLFLVGMMGSGKTIVGQALARSLDYFFFELDAAVEEAEGRTITEIFQRHGEGHFRIVERDMLRTTINLHATVVATGGGAPCFWDGMDFIHKAGTSIYLRATVRTLVQRVSNTPGTRPLLTEQHEPTLVALLAQRSSEYARADYTIDVDDLSVEEVVDAVLNVLKHGSSPPVAG